MKLNSLIPCVVLTVIIALQSQAQTQYVTIKNGNYPLETNQLITLVGYDWTATPAIFGAFPDGSQTTISPYTLKYSAYSNTGLSVYAPAGFYTSTPIPTQMFTGLTNVWISGASATLRVETPVTTTVISNYVPADAIVIPASASGNVQIILESSSDLINWTAAAPGTYGPSSATNRFFRVRGLIN